MSSTSNSQNLLTNVFRPTYVYDPEKGYVPKLVVSNVDSVKGTSGTFSNLNIGDALTNVYVGINAGNPPTLATACNSTQITALGLNAGSNNSNCENSVFMGNSAGSNASNVDDSVYIGRLTGNYNSNCANSVYIGTRAAFELCNASNEVAIGTNAVAGGLSNVYIGASTGSSGSSNIFIGPGIAPGNVSNQLRIGSASNVAIYGDLATQKIGINTIPTVGFDVSGAAYFNNKVGIQFPDPIHSLDVAGQIYATNGILMGAGSATAPAIALVDETGTGVFAESNASEGRSFGFTIKGKKMMTVNDSCLNVFGNMYIEGSFGAGASAASNTILTGYFRSPDIFGAQLDISGTGIKTIGNVSAGGGTVLIGNGFITDTSTNGYIRMLNDAAVKQIDMSGGNISNSATTRSSNFIGTAAASNSIGGNTLSNNNLSNTGTTTTSNISYSGTITGSTPGSSNVIGGNTLSNGNLVNTGRISTVDISYTGGIIGNTATSSNRIGGNTLSNNNLSNTGTTTTSNISYSGAITGTTVGASNVIGGNTLSNNNLSNTGTTTTSNISYSGAISNSTTASSNLIGGNTLSNGDLVNTGRISTVDISYTGGIIGNSDGSSNRIGGVVLSNRNLSNVSNINYAGAITASTPALSNSIGGVVLSGSNISNVSNLVYSTQISNTNTNTSNLIGGVTLSNTNIIYAGVISNSTGSSSNRIGGVVLSNSNVSNVSNFNYAGTITGSTTNTSNVIGGVLLSNNYMRANGTSTLINHQLADINIRQDTIQFPNTNSSNKLLFFSDGSADNRYGFGLDSGNINYSAGNFGSARHTFGFYTAGGYVERLAVLSNGNVGIGTTTPTTTLDVSGTLTASGRAVFGSNALNATAHPFEVVGSVGNGDVRLARFTNNSTTSGHLAAFVFPNVSNAVGGIANQYYVSIGKLTTNVDVGNYGQLRYHYFSDNSTSNVMALVNSAGNGMWIRNNNCVSIGTLSTPLYALDIGGPGTTDVRIASGGVTNGAGGQLNFGIANGNGATNPMAAIKGQLVNFPTIGGTAQEQGGLGFYTRASNATVSQNLDERMRITHDGNVGIGTTTPGRTLDVNGTFRITNDAEQQLLRSTSLTGTPYIYAHITSNRLRIGGWSDAGTSRALVLNDIGGSVGIGLGTAAPAYALDVAGVISTTSNFRVNAKNYIHRTGLSKGSTYGLCYTTSVQSGGGIISYTADTTNGDSFTVSSNGIYCINITAAGGTVFSLDYDNPATNFIIQSTSAANAANLVAWSMANGTAETGACFVVALDTGRTYRLKYYANLSNSVTSATRHTLFISPMYHTT